MKSTFIGIDASLEISLLEYGLIVSNEVHEDGSGTHFCVYKCNGGYGTGHISEADLNNLINGEDWANEEDINSFLSFVGMSKNDFLQMPLITKLFDLISYWGYENIMGTEYYPMNEKETIERYLNPIN